LVESPKKGKIMDSCKNLHFPNNEENYIHYYRYQKFIKSRSIRNLKREKGFNIHHVVPRSLGGGNDNSNLIKLTIREHYIAHLILWKCGYKEMVNAFWLMSHDSRFNKNKLTSRLFEKLQKDKSNSCFWKIMNASEKEEYRARISKSQKGKIFSEDYRKKLSMASKGVPKSEKHKESLRKAGLGRKISIEQIQKTASKNTGQKRDEKTKIRMSIAQRGIKNPSARKVQCIETGEIFSLMKMANLKIYKNEKSGNIWRAIKTDKPVKGYSWQYVD
jgi:hypothetical protein